MMKVLRDPLSVRASTARLKVTPTMKTDKEERLSEDQIPSDGEESDEDSSAGEVSGPADDY
jgi:hypothetical protein